MIKKSHYFFEYLKCLLIVYLWRRLNLHKNVYLFRELIHITKKKYEILRSINYQ
jgi:hypothetical protein